MLHSPLFLGNIHTCNALCRYVLFYLYYAVTAALWNEVSLNLSASLNKLTISTTQSFTTFHLLEQRRF